jgi:hypothetical protein
MRERFGEDTAIKAAGTMINLAASVLSCMIGVERAIRVLEVTAASVEEAGGPSRSRR